MAENNFYVGISDPKDLRRNVLESSKEIVGSMETNKKLKSIREAKVKEYERMRKIMEELDYLLGKLKNRMPKGVRKSTHTHHKRAKDSLSPEVKKLDKALNELEGRFSKTS